MPIVNFKLEGELLKFVQDYIKSGLATSKSEVIRIALVKLREEEHLKTSMRKPKMPDNDKSIR